MKNGKSAKSDIDRYRENYLSEQEGMYLYHMLADSERDAHLAELFRRIADIEQRHADMWKGYLNDAGEPLPNYTPNWRVRTLGWIAKHLGTGAIMSTVTSMESNAVHDYDNQPEAVATGLPGDERSHARLFSYLRSSTRGGIAGPLPISSMKASIVFSWIVCRSDDVSLLVMPQLVGSAVRVTLPEVAPAGMRICP